MGYADRFYYGQCKLIVNKDVTVTDGTKEWTGRTFMLPGTQKYTVSDGENTKDIYAGYGDCINLEM